MVSETTKRAMHWNDWDFMATEEEKAAYIKAHPAAEYTFSVGPHPQ